MSYDIHEFHHFCVGFPLFPWEEGSTHQPIQILSPGNFCVHQKNIFFLVMSYGKVNFIITIAEARSGGAKGVSVPVIDLRKAEERGEDH